MTNKYLKNYLKIALITGVVVVLALIALDSQAVGSTFATNSNTGGLELKIDNKTFYNGVLQPTLSWSLKDLIPTSDKFFSFSGLGPPVSQSITATVCTIGIFVPLDI